jgi:hypothetical protein
VPWPISRKPVTMGWRKSPYRRFFPGKTIIFGETRAHIICAGSR